jgi:hypothetical protein
MPELLFDTKGLRVTSDAVFFGDQSVPMRSVTSVELTPVGSWGLVGAAVLVLLATAFTGVCLLITIPAVIYTLLDRKNATLKMKAGSTTHTLLVTRSQEEAERARDAILSRLA